MYKIQTRRSKMKNMHKICRICLADDRHLINIYNQKMEFPIEIYQIIIKCTGLKVFRNDGMPSHICGECVCLLGALYRYQEKCNMSDKILRQVSAGSERGDACDYQQMIHEDIELKIPTKTISYLHNLPNKEDKGPGPTDTPFEFNNTYELIQEKESNYFIDNKISLLDNESDWPIEYLEDDENFDLKNVKHEIISTNIYACQFCSNAFDTFDGLSNHLKLHLHHHGDTYERKCKHCNLKFSNRTKYYNHLCTHNDIKPHCCNMCNRRYISKQSLEIHLRSHLTVKPYQCEYCPKRFVQKCEVVAHTRTHTKEKPFVCNYCSKGFSLKKYLKYHIMTHTKLKPYKCDICDMCFRRPVTLTVHKRLHSGERPFSCKECTQTFVSQSNMNKHVRTRH